MKKILLFIRLYISMLNGSLQEAAEPGLKKKEKDTPAYIHLLLLIATIMTTTLAGARSYSSLTSILVTGLPFSVTIITILLAHEMGHYLAARRFGLRVSLPYFIPFPSLIGTMGAVIRIKSPVTDRRALLIIGASGPVVGFILSLIAAAFGIYVSDIRPIPALTGTIAVPVFGDSLLFAFLTRIIHGPMPAGHDLFLSPYAWAGWIGFLVTSLNLLPFGQLDGGHILYALIGRRQRYIGWIAFLSLAALSILWPGWLVWIALILLFLMVGHPEGTGSDPLPRIERAFGWLCALIFMITFIPRPVYLLENNGVYPVECPQCREYLEPSGITMRGSDLFAVSDTGSDPAIYSIENRSGILTATPFIRLHLPGVPVPDLEGIASSGSDFYLVEEKSRSILRAGLSGHVAIVSHNIEEYNRRKGISFSKDANAGFEGIAIDDKKGEFYLANEREPAVIYLLKADVGSLTTLRHYALAELLDDRQADVSDLFFEKGSLYILYRRKSRIIRLDTASGRITHSYDFSPVTEGLYFSAGGYGFAEGLHLTPTAIYLALDSNAAPLVGRKGGRNGAIVILPRPEGF